MLFDITAHGGHDCPIESLDLAIRLWMVSRRERVVHVQDSRDVQEELRRELFTVVGNQLGRWAVSEDPVVNERTGYFAPRYPLQRDGPNQLGEPIHDYQEVLVAAGTCLLYTSPSPRDQRGSRMPSSA